MILSAWVLVIVVGGFSDRSAAMTAIDMPLESVCLAAANKAKNEIKNMTAQAFCIKREAAQ